jgi:small subunit ribosomal protein S11
MPKPNQKGNHGQFSILYVKFRYHNIFVTATDSNGNVISSSSSGCHGFSGSKKNTSLAGKTTMNFVIAKAESKSPQSDSIELFVCGGGSSTPRDFIPDCLKHIRVTKMSEHIPLRMGGVKSPKKPRK